MSMALFCILAKSANDVDISDERILCYKKGQAPRPPIGYLSQPKVLYTSGAVKPSGSVGRGLRYIPNSPERILDAPNFMDDYCKRRYDFVVLQFAAYTGLFRSNAEGGVLLLLLILFCSLLGIFINHKAVLAMV